MSEKSAGEGLDPLNEIFSGPNDQRDLAEMVARDGRPVITRFTIILGVAALVLGGIIVGAHFEAQNASANASSAAVSALRSAFGGQGTRSAGATSTLGAGGFGAGGFNAPVASGQIKLIDGANIYVSTDTGSIVKVATDGTTQIRKSATLTIGQLKVGDTVSVSGQNGADGTVTATSINVSAAQAASSTPTQKSLTGSASPSATSPIPAKTPTPSGTATHSAGGFQKLTACMQKKGITVDPTQGIRALRNSTDPKVRPPSLPAGRPRSPALPNAVAICRGAVLLTSRGGVAHCKDQSPKLAARSLIRTERRVFSPSELCAR